MGASGVIMFSILPADVLGAQDESASEAITTRVKTQRDDRSILCFGNVLIFCFIRESFAIIFTEYQSACLTIYICHYDLVTFDKLALIWPVTR